MEERSIMVL